MIQQYFASWPICQKNHPTSQESRSPLSCRRWISSNIAFFKKTFFENKCAFPRILKNDVQNGSANGEEQALKEPASHQLPEDEIAALYRQHGERLTAFAFGLVKDHELAREVVQNTFAKAIDHAGAVSAKSLRAWLYQVARNEALQLRRQARRETKALEQNRNRPDRPLPEPLDQLVQQERIERLRQAVNQLPVEQRVIVQRRIQHEQTFAEIAEELDIPLGTVLTRMRLALKKLRQCLTDPT